MSDYEFFNPRLTGICPECGEMFPQNQKGRPKRFCSEKCRTRFHHANPNPGNWKSTRIAECPVCGKEFLASREYAAKRKYCSRACANRGRTAEKRGERMP